MTRNKAKTIATLIIMKSALLAADQIDALKPQAGANLVTSAVTEAHTSVEELSLKAITYARTSANQYMKSLEVGWQRYLLLNGGGTDIKPVYLTGDSEMIKDAKAFKSDPSYLITDLNHFFTNARKYERFLYAQTLLGIMESQDHASILVSYKHNGAYERIHAATYKVLESSSTIVTDHVVRWYARGRLLDQTAPGLMERIIGQYEPDTGLFITPDEIGTIDQMLGNEVVRSRLIDELLEFYGDDKNGEGDINPGKDKLWAEFKTLTSSPAEEDKKDEAIADGATRTFDEVALTAQVAQQTKLKIAKDMLMAGAPDQFILLTGITQDELTALKDATK
jgi:hypothetical protein